MKEVGSFTRQPIPSVNSAGEPVPSTTFAWVPVWVWTDGVELRSAGWTIENIIVKGADRLADDLIASGILAAQVIPDGGAPALGAGPRRSWE